MKRVTQKWEVIDIDTYEDEKHMRNILIKYSFEWASMPHSLDVLRSLVNRYIQRYVQNIPEKIITPITYDGEWLEIIKKKFWFRYEEDLEILSITDVLHYYLLIYINETDNCIIRNTWR